MPVREEMILAARGSMLFVVGVLVFLYDRTVEFTER